MTEWHDRTVDGAGRVVITSRSRLWVLRRLACDLHRRFYHDIGMEAHSLPGEVLALRTPYCQQGDRDLGVLEIPAGVDGPVAQCWTDFLRHQCTVLETTAWLTRRHLGCFHRRGKARFDLAYAIAVELLHLRAAESGTIQMVSSAAQLPAELTWWWDEQGWGLAADKPSRFIAVSDSIQIFGLLGTDGVVAGTEGPIDVAAGWQSGASLAGLARALIGAGQVL
ncbi:hypothetical protein ACFCV3_00540 [Kribbella sp. NPDC056345]|uniref:hypothetical protein n=1 Tax=Kribbella sp. NPDC056345 TaxID=3345789 RepID=UPI0035DEB70F